MFTEGYNSMTTKRNILWPQEDLIRSKIKNHKIYFDCGDQTLDAMYPEIQHKVDDLMLRKGFTKKNWITEYFPGEDHSEKAWSKRFRISLEFLLKN